MKVYTGSGVGRGGLMGLEPPSFFAPSTESLRSVSLFCTVLHANSMEMPSNGYADC